MTFDDFQIDVYVHLIWTCYLTITIYYNNNSYNKSNDNNSSNNDDGDDDDCGKIIIPFSI